MGLYQWVGPGTDIGDGDNWRDEIHGTTGTEPSISDDVTMYTAGSFSGQLDVDSITLQSQGTATLAYVGADTYIETEGTTTTTVTGSVTFNRSALDTAGLVVESDSTLRIINGAGFDAQGAGDSDITIGSQSGTATLLVDNSSFFAQLNGGTFTVGDGDSGVGSLTVEDGSGFQVAAGLTLIGNDDGAGAKVLVTGALTAALFDGRVEIGGEGNGSFTASAGAYASLGLHDNVAVGSLSGTGTITATGANTLLSVAGNLEFGAYQGVSSGTGIVSQGATLAVAGDILVYAGSISVSGAGSMLSGRAFLPQAPDQLSIAAGSTASFVDASVLSGSTVLLTGGTLAVRRVLGISAKIGGYGVVRAAAVLNDGTLTANGGTLQVIGPETGAGTDAIAKGATLELDGSVAAQVRILFQAGAGTLSLKDAGAMDGLIRGFGTGEKIDLLGDASTGMSFANDILMIQNGNAVDATLRFSGSYTAANFALSSDGHGGSLVSYVAAGTARVDAVHGIGPGVMLHAV